MSWWVWLIAIVVGLLWASGGQGLSKLWIIGAVGKFLFGDRPADTLVENVAPMINKEAGE